MNTSDLSMNVLQTFLDTARAYLDLARQQGAMAAQQTKQRTLARLQVVAKPALLVIESRKNLLA